MTTSRENFGLVLGLIGMVLFAGTLPASRIAVVTLDPSFLTAARAAIAGILGAAILIATGPRRLPRGAALRDIAVAAVCLVLGFPLLSAFAMMTVPAAHGGVVLGILPLATATAAAVLAHERPSLGFWLAGAAGTALVVAFTLRGGAGTISPSSLESANTELSEELTDMIVAQRAYQASSKVIKTASDLLDELNRLTS